jgi:hypothetical protein
MRKLLASIVVSPASVLAASTAALATPTGVNDALESSGSTARTAAWFTGGTGIVRGRQTCVSAGQGITYYGPYIGQLHPAKSRTTYCAISSISSYGAQIG